MADFVLARKSRNIASNLVHIFLNILLGISVVLITVFSGSPVLGFLLVLISKWRMFAVRRRYLWLNIKANLVDIIFGMSMVLLSYYAGAEFQPIHVILMVLSIVWLLVIKPMSSENATLIQAMFAVFFGISASTIMTANADAVFAVLFAFLIGYASSRHVLSQTNSRDYTLTTLISGLIFAEVALLCHSWAIIYEINFPLKTGIRIPQAAIILTVFTFVYNYVRQTMIRYQDDFRFRDIVGPVLFGVILVGIIVIWFSDPMFNI